MNWTDRWAARVQRNADRHDDHFRKHQEALRAGTERPTLGDRFSASWQQLVPQDNRAFQQRCRVIQLLTAGPVSGPDGIPVLLALGENSLQFLSPRPPRLPMPEPWLRAIAAEPTLTGQAARTEMTACLPRFAYATAMSGPPLRIRRRFQYSSDAADYVLALAEEVRSRGAEALR